MFSRAFCCPDFASKLFCVTMRRTLSAMDLFVAPTIGFDLPYAFVIVRLDRRDHVWINVTANRWQNGLHVK
jgi:hypothetical protein